MTIFDQSDKIGKILIYFAFNTPQFPTIIDINGTYSCGNGNNVDNNDTNSNNDNTFNLAFDSNSHFISNSELFEDNYNFVYNSYAIKLNNKVNLTAIDFTSHITL